MKIAISGGTGFIGTYLSTFLFKKDIRFTFSQEKKLLKLLTLTFSMCNGHQIYKPSSSIDVVINLAGESINSRWTKKQKKIILNSRIQTTKGLIKQLQALLQNHIHLLTRVQLDTMERLKPSLYRTACDSRK